MSDVNKKGIKNKTSWTYSLQDNFGSMDLLHKTDQETLKLDTEKLEW